ncbi:MAG TPA: multidrug efflux RND transporter permease subunit [Pirellulales bacterium]|jgi:multidrug efflux pump subunit AcrB|nr:multidrug efflux RND transporter permease subunit [Pirellulales bacterium]
MFSTFFINRPIFASVLSIIITLAGSVARFTLPIAQYPLITPPTIEVSATYPGANAQVVVDTVAAPIEQQVVGVEGMLYMSSQCTNDGAYVLTVTFHNGVDLNMAQVLVQNREALAEPILPDLVKRRGITVKKKSPSTLMIVNLFSPDGRRDNLYLSNYATIQLKDELARLEGVGDIAYIGQRDYSMRLWLDPEKMSTLNLSANDVVQAIEQQNTQVAAGQIGQPPVKSGQTFQYTISTMGRLADPEEFAGMILKADASGRIVRVKDVARIELGAQGYDQTCRLDGKPSVALSIYQLPGSNALEIARRVRAKMDDLKSRFPEGLDYSIVYDTTPFIDESISEVYKTLRDAVILVAIVVLVFLQNWRSAIIPLIAVPVAIVGTFAVMAAMGFSLNNLTLFGLVLAIGIVVDDAIVVVEAVEHHIETGLSPRDATIKAMEQVSGPVIAVGLVLSAVFIPCAFISGIMGQFFRQFALTISVSTVISAFNSLTLSPALTALLLRPRDKHAAPPLPWLVFVLSGAWAGWEFLSNWVAAAGQNLPIEVTPAVAPWIGAALGAIAGGIVAWPLNKLLGIAFRWFNRGFDYTSRFYTWTVGKLLRVSVLALAAYGFLLYLTYAGFNIAPKGFIPSQDKGYLVVNLQLPDSASVGRTEQVMQRMEEESKKIPGVKHTVGISGQSILLGANSPNFGAMYVMLDDFYDRLSPDLSAEAIRTRLQDRLQSDVSEGIVQVLGAPPLEGLGNVGGFKMMIEDRGNGGLQVLQDVADATVADGLRTPGLRDLFTSFRANTPWLYLDIDRTAAKTLGISMAEVFNTLQVYIGSLYVNDFNEFGRTWQVNVQADKDFRQEIDGLKQLKMRTDKGGMVPFGSFAQVRDIAGPALVNRYNMYPAAAINGSPDEGVSSGQAIELMQNVVNKNLSWSMRSEWTELALLQLQTGNTAMMVFLLAVVLVFLVLAAQYESWSLPLAVILVVPMCLLCSIAAVLFANLDINIFTQVGFVVLIGLACKNAILIVEFARARRIGGMTRFDATLAACRLRLRPIVMTSFAFILGVVPLVLSVGAGAEMRRTLGTAVFGGMLGVTLFGIFLTPVFFYVIEGINDLTRRIRRWYDTDQEDSEPREPQESKDHPLPPVQSKPLIQRPVEAAVLTVVETGVH